MVRRKAADVQADRTVDQEHRLALQVHGPDDNPVAYLRRAQAEAEAAYAAATRYNAAYCLALVLAFERSLDGSEKG